MNMLKNNSTYLWISIEPETDLFKILVCNRAISKLKAVAQSGACCH